MLLNDAHSFQNASPAKARYTAASYMYSYVKN